MTSSLTTFVVLIFFFFSRKIAAIIFKIAVLQIDVATQRGFIPVDERMRVIDANGKLVGCGFPFSFFSWPNVVGFLLSAYTINCS